MTVALVLPLLALAISSGVREPSLAEVLGRAGEYTERLGEKIATVIGEETYTQQRVLRSSGEALESRLLSSEVAFQRLSGSTEWLALRSVVEIDNRATGTRGRLARALLGEEGRLAQARAIADESAKYNLGPLQRNFNVPTLVLQFLHPDNRDRFRFRRAGEEAQAGERVWILDFEERARPSMIRAPDGKSLPARGRIWIVPGDGRVVRTQLIIDDFHPPVTVRSNGSRPVRRVKIRSTARIEARFGLDHHLREWLPAEMRERYEGAWWEGPAEEEHLRYDIVGAATYANYRRFDVDIRIR